MQNGSAIAVDSARVLARERKHILVLAFRLLEIEIRQPLPTPAYADHLATVFRGAIGDFFDDRVQSGNVASAGENADPLVCHGRVSSSFILRCAFPPACEQ